MKIYDIDYTRLVRLLLPTLLRKELYIIMLNSMVSGVRSIYSHFLFFRDENLYRLSITPQVFSLEKLLNDRFDADKRRIYITDGEFYKSKYLYTQKEDQPLFVRTTAENKPLFINKETETGSKGVDFLVYVPLSLIYDDKVFRGLLDAYKLVSKTYEIIKI